MKKKSNKATDSQNDPIAWQIFDAIQHSQYQRLALYQRHDYNLNIIGKDGRNGLFYALDIADSAKRTRMIHFCLDQGINPLQRDFTYGHSPLHEAIDRQQVDSFQIIFDDVKSEYDWRAFDNRGRTILHQAVEANNVKIMEALVSTMAHYKISVDIYDKNGLTPYLLAVKLHLPEMANILLNKGHASRQQRDLQLHRSAQEWEMAGIKENYFNARQKLRYDIDKAMKDGKINRVKALRGLYFFPPVNLKNQLHRSSVWSTTTGSGTCHRSINEMMDLLTKGDQPDSFVLSKGEEHGSMINLNALPPIKTSRLYGRHPKYHSLTDLNQIDSM